MAAVSGQHEALGVVFGGIMEIRGIFEADLEGGSKIPLGKVCCAQRLGDKLVVGVPSPGSSTLWFPQPPPIFLAFLSQARHREKNT